MMMILTTTTTTLTSWLEANVALATWLVIVGGFFSMVLSFTALEWLDPACIRPYRINQSNTAIPIRTKWSAFAITVFNMMCIVTPGIYLTSTWFDTYFPHTISSGALLPSVSTVILQCTLGFVIDDMWFYTYHRYLHEHRGLYGRFHKLHHAYNIPFALASNAVHPVELLLQSVGTLAVPVLCRSHIVTVWVWLTLRQAQGIEDHVGYDFPWSPTSLLSTVGGVPFTGGAAFHDFHHTKNVGNYGSTFALFDYMLGTDRLYTHAAAAKTT